MEKRPWLDYTGQSTAELLACKSSHAIASLLCAFEEGIQAKLREQGEGAVTEEEKVVLAVEALAREVNNGGFHQFFWNSSRKFAPIAVESLRQIGCDATAAIAARAIAALRLPVVSVEAVEEAIQTEDEERDGVLNGCDDEFYRLDDAMDDRLFRFVEAHQARIHPLKPWLPKIRRLDETARRRIHLYTGLLFTKKKDLSLADIRHLARELAKKDATPATEEDIEGVAVLYALHCALGRGDLDACRELGPRSLELMREDTTQCVLYRDWVQKLAAASQNEMADASALAYLEYLKSADQSTRSTRNRIKFWIPPLQQHRAALPKSVQFYQANFPQVSLDARTPNYE